MLDVTIADPQTSQVHRFKEIVNRHLKKRLLYRGEMLHQYTKKMYAAYRKLLEKVECQCNIDTSKHCDRAIVAYVLGHRRAQSESLPAVLNINRYYTLPVVQESGSKTFVLLSFVNVLYMNNPRIAVVFPDLLVQRHSETLLHSLKDLKKILNSPDCKALPGWEQYVFRIVFLSILRGSSADSSLKLRWLLEQYEARYKG